MKTSGFRSTVKFVSRTVMVIENFYCPIILIKINRYRYYWDKINNLRITGKNWNILKICVKWRLRFKYLNKSTTSKYRHCQSPVVNRKENYLATLTSQFTDLNFDGVVLEVYPESQIPVTTKRFELHTV